MILYLHGFLSSGNSFKGQWMKAEFAALGIDVLTPTYPISDPEQTAAAIDAEIHAAGLVKKKAAPWCIMGSSMGGFWGHYFAQKYRVPLVMINPALNPTDTLSPYLGTHANPATAEVFQLTHDYLKSLKQYACQPDESLKTLVLLDEGDEVIPYQSAKLAFEKIATVKVFKGGDHAFQHLEDAWGEIEQFVRQAGITQ